MYTVKMGSVCGKLSKQDFEFLKLNTNCDEKTIKRTDKKFKKKSRKVQLSPALFYDMYVRLYPTDNAKDYCNRVFRTFDEDNNGYISFKAFLLSINIRNNGNPEQKLNWTFKLYDINGDGVINKCEMIIIVEPMFDMLDDRQVQRKVMQREGQRSIFKTRCKWISSFEQGRNCFWLFE